MAYVTKGNSLVTCTQYIHCTPMCMLFTCFAIDYYITQPLVLHLPIVLISMILLAFICYTLLLLKVYSVIYTILACLQSVRFVHYPAKSGSYCLIAFCGCHLVSSLCIYVTVLHVSEGFLHGICYFLSDSA